MINGRRKSMRLLCDVIDRPLDPNELKILTEIMKFSTDKDLFRSSGIRDIQLMTYSSKSKDT